MNFYVSLPFRNVANSHYPSSVTRYHRAFFFVFQLFASVYCKEDFAKLYSDVRLYFSPFFYLVSFGLSVLLALYFLFGVLGVSLTVA